MGLLNLKARLRSDDPGDDHEEELDDDTIGDETLFFSSGPNAGGTNFTAVPRKRDAAEATPTERKAKMMVWGMLAALPLALLAILIGIAGLATGGSSGDDGNTSDVDTSSEFEGFAQIIATDYLAGRNTIVPTGAANLSNFADARRGSDEAGREPAQPTPIAYDDLVHLRYETLIFDSNEFVEVHYFAVHTANSVLQLAVPIANNNGPVLAGLPSLAPIRVGTEPTRPPLDWSKRYDKADMWAGALTQIQRWATAYAANDPQALFSVTGDPQTNTYIGLGGFTAVDGVRVLSSGQKKLDDGTAAIVASVQLTLTASGDARLTLRSTYDVLLTDIDKAEPYVAAWGPNGSGPRLFPYMNAQPAAPSSDQTTSTAANLTPEG